jgi:atlastin
LQAAGETNTLKAVAAAKETYRALMEGVCGGAKPYLSTARLEVEHQRIKEKSLNHFINKCQVGVESFSESYKEKLD